MGEELTGDNRCWPCTAVNAVAGLFVAGIPLVAALLEGEPVVIAVAAVWAVGVLGFTLFRLLAKGYLPYAEQIAKATKLHDRIGPRSRDEDG